MKTLLIICSISFIGAIISLFSIKQQTPGLPDLNTGKCAVQLNYNWNKTNDYAWKAIPNVKYYYLSLDNFPELKTKMKIKTVPTIVVLQNGQEIKRFEGGLMMKITETQAQICQ